MKHVLALFVAAILLPDTLSAQTASADTALPNGAAVGRHQIVANPTGHPEVFLLDTATGKVWKMVQYADARGKPYVWKYMERADDPSAELLLHLRLLKGPLSSPPSDPGHR